MRFDVLEIDAEIVGGVTEAVGAEVGREEFAGFLCDVDAGGGFDGRDVFGGGKASGEFLRVGEEEVRGGVDVFVGPDGSGLDPLMKVGLFLGRKRRAFFWHFVGFDSLPNE